MAAKKETELPLINREVDILTRTLQELLLKIEYNTFIDKNHRDRADDEELLSLKAQKEDCEVKIKVLLMVLQYPILYRMNHLTLSEKIEIIDKNIDALKNEKAEKEKELYSLTNPVRPTPPPEFLTWSEEEKRAHVKKTEKERSETIAANNEKRKELEETIEELDEKIKAYSTEEGRKQIVREYFAENGIFLDTEKKPITEYEEEVTDILGVLDFIPKGGSLEIAKYLYKNQYVLKEIIASYRELRLLKIESPTPFNRFSQSLFYGVIKTPSGQTLEDLIGIKPAYTYEEIKARYEKKDSYIEELRRKKDVNLRQVQEVRDLVVAKRLMVDGKPPISTKDLRSILENDFSESKFFLDRISELVEKSRFLRETAGDEALTGIIKPEELDSNEKSSLETQLLQLQERYKEANRKRFIDNKKRKEKRLSPIRDEMAQLISDFNGKYSTLNCALTEKVFAPRVLNLELRQMEGTNHNVYNAVMSRTDRPYEEYVSSINSEFNESIRTLTTAFEADMKNANDLYNSKKIPTEDAIISKLQPVIGQEMSRERILGIGATAVKGLFGDIFERSMPTEEQIANKSSLPNISIDQEQLLAAKRKAALAEYLAQRRDMNDEVRRYADGSVAVDLPTKQK